MLKQKEYDFLMKKFEQNNMEGYEEWFNQNINSENKRDISLTEMQSFQTAFELENLD